MKLFGYDLVIDKQGKSIPFKDITLKLWVGLLFYLPSVFYEIVKMELRRRFFHSIYGVAIYHRTWEVYKESPLFKYRYQEVGIEHAIDAFTIKEFDFFRSKVLKDKEFMKDVFFHPYEVLDELLDSDVMWKQRWANKIDKT